MYDKKPLKKLWIGFFGLVLCFVIGFLFSNNSSFATESSSVVETNFFGNFEDDGSGCGVYTILNLVIDILSMGVVIAGVIGVTIAGIQYMSAKDSEEKTKKAKRRIFEIVIGLVAYAILFVGVQWLLPGGMMNSSCRSISDAEMAQIKENEKNQKIENTEKTAKEKTKKERQKAQKENKEYKKCMERAAKVVRNKICKYKKPGKKLSETALALAWPVGYVKKSENGPTAAFKKAMYETKTNQGENGNHCRRIGKACGMFVGTVVRAAGIDKSFPKMASKIYPYVKKSSRWKEVSTSRPKAGDISLSYFENGEAGHVSIYVKNKKGKIVTAEASLCDYWGRVKGSKKYTSSKNKTFRRVDK